MRTIAPRVGLGENKKAHDKVGSVIVLQLISST